MAMALRTVMVVWIPHSITGAERAPRHWKLLTAAEPIIRSSGPVQNFYRGSANRNPFHRVISADLVRSGPFSWVQTVRVSGRAANYHGR
jgi:hypothetical protein